MSDFKTNSPSLPLRIARVRSPNAVLQRTNSFAPTTGVPSKLQTTNFQTTNLQTTNLQTTNSVCTHLNSATQLSSAKFAKPNSLIGSSTPTCESTTTATNTNQEPYFHTMSSKITNAGPTIRCPKDTKLMCRLIGLHKTLQPPSQDSPHPQITFNIESTTTASPDTFTIHDVITIGKNLKCLIAEEPIRKYLDRRQKDFPSQIAKNTYEVEDMADGRHVCIAFNWFSPLNLWDMVSLGYLILTKNEIDPKEKMLGSFYLEKASEFFWSSQMQRWLEQNYLTAGSGGPFGSPNSIKLITLTGFSFGGSIAHAFAYILRERKQLRIPLRVVGLGCPRPGSRLFRAWCEEELTSDSLNVILFDEDVDSSSGESTIEYDPATQGPPMVNGFDHHPNCYLLHKKFGTLRPLTTDEGKYMVCNETAVKQAKWRSFLSNALPSTNRDKSWKRLHGVVKYYEGMYGLG